MITKEITKLVEGALQSLGREGKVVLEHPADLSHGDYSCNVAMVLAQREGEAPRQSAARIVAALPPNEYVKRVEIAGPGFINFFLSEQFFTESTHKVITAGKTWGENNHNQGKTILLEHSSPNLFKPFHIGHMVNNAYGESLVRLTRATGATVIPLSFPSDVSPGIAKAVWGIMQKMWEDDITIEHIGEAYVYGVAQYDEDADAKAEIDAINKTLYEHEEGTPEWNIYEQGRELSLSYFLSITKRLGSHFDKLIFESEAETEGKQIVREHTPGVFEESDGAIIFRGSAHGLFDNVFINAMGYGTYLAKDLGLLKIKFQQYQCDASLTVTDTEQKQHFQLVRKAAGLITPEWEEKSTYIQHGRLELTTGKISSRHGGVPLAQDVLDAVAGKVLDRMKASEKGVGVETAQQVALAAIKYAIVRVGMGKNITFDMDQSLALEGDTGPYLQYAYARTRSILDKATAQGAFDINEDTSTCPERGDDDITEVERLVYRFEEVVARAADEYEPHYVANYLSQLASAFNRWYAHEQILDGTERQVYKVAITKSVAGTLWKGLDLLGVEAPKSM